MQSTYSTALELFDGSIAYACPLFAVADLENALRKIQ